MYPELTIKNVIELKDIMSSVSPGGSCGVIFREYRVFLIELLDNISYQIICVQDVIQRIILT